MNLEPSPIMDSQWRLFRTKAFSDFSVLLSLIFSLAFSQYAWSLYIDPVASFFIAGVLFFSGDRVIRRPSRTCLTGPLTRNSRW